MANEIYDGTRVFDAADAAQIMAVDHNDYQDQMILGMEARTRLIGPAAGLADDNDPGNWRWRTDTNLNYPYWQEGVCTSEDALIVPLPLRKNEYIEDFYVLIKGSVATPPAASPGGIHIYYNYLDLATPAAPAKVSAADLGLANPWNLAGAFHVYSSIGLNLNAAATEDRFYYLSLTSHDDAGAGFCEYYGCKMVTRFHIGT